MKALVIGQGGREHALVRALKLSSRVTEVHAAPGSDGIAQDARCHAIDWQDKESLIGMIHREAIDFVVIGPEIPLVGGLADTLRARGVRVVGPSGDAARLEGSKIFCKDFLLAAGIPTARSQVVSTVDEALRAAREYAPPYVLKADGLAAGKGVFICKTENDLRFAAQSIFVEKSLGEAGGRALLEEFQPGFEISYLVLINGHSFAPLPFAQDHKRLADGDEGPNTGGMGVVAPVAMDEALRAQIDREVIEPTLAEIRKRGMLYRGVLFVGLMMTPQGPSVLEFNTRFGDPETQAILPLLDGDWGFVMSELADGRLPKLEWKNAASCCVVMAAEGYPDRPVKDAAIEGLDPAQSSESRYFLHAGSRRDAVRGWLTAGGRVLNSIGLGSNLRAAIDSAYAQSRSASWVGMQQRSDIGAKISEG